VVIARHFGSLGVFSYAQKIAAGLLQRGAMK